MFVGHPSLLHALHAQPYRRVHFRRATTFFRWSIRNHCADLLYVLCRDCVFAGEAAVCAGRASASKLEIQRRSTKQVSRSTVDLTMKLKTLRKKVRRLEVRLEKGPKKLAKLKRKLEAAEKAAAGKTKRKSTARVGEGRRSVKGSAQTQKKKGRVTAEAQVRPATAEKRSAAKKAKRKLNLSPERRAQLAAAMKARWAAKRTAAGAILQQASTDGDSTIGEAPRAL